MSRTQQSSVDNLDADPVECECAKCDSTDVIPHSPKSITQNDDGTFSVETSDEPRVCFECVGSGAHWEARDEVRNQHMPDDPYSGDSNWGDWR